MPKNIKIILIIVGIVLSVTIVFLFFFGKNVQQPNQPSASQTPTNLFTIPDQNSSRMTLEQGNSKIESKNLYQNPIEILSQNAVVFGRSANFDSSFYPQDQGFIITLLGSDLELARQEAENNFLEKLGITKEQSCKLKVQLGTPAFVNDKAAGVNYGLSFCPNGKPLPKQ